MIYEIHDSRDDCTVFAIRRGASDEDSWNEYKYGNPAHRFVDSDSR